jgi:hypothetical protein
MSFTEILEELSKLTEAEKLELRNRLDEELLQGQEESDELLAELDAAVGAADAGGPTFSIGEMSERWDGIIERHISRSKR